VIIKTERLTVQTKGNNDVIDITEEVAHKVRDSGVSDGIVTVFLPGSTAGITTIESEPELVKDLKEIIDKIIPKGRSYRHPINPFSHIGSALFGTSFSCPFNDKKLLLGAWQQIVLIDFDNRPRSREVVAQIIGQ